MKWEYFGTGLAFIGIGVTLMLALPPPGWPRMPPPLVHIGVIVGATLTVIGILVAGFGMWPALPNPKLAFLGMGSAVLLFGACAAWFWIIPEKTFSIDDVTAIDKRAEIRKQLQQFYVNGGIFIDADLPKDISDEIFKAYEGAANQWTNNSADWITEHIGQAARAKFLDMSSTSYVIYNKKVNDSHNNIINAVVAFRKNLSTLIETDTWDDKK